MTILDALNRLAGGSSVALMNFLKRAGEVAPDLKPLADSLTASLGAAVPIENLISLAAVLPGEIAALAQGKVIPKDHPSDGI